MKSRAKEFLELARRDTAEANDSLSPTLDGLEALADFLEDHDPNVLVRLGGKTDPQSIRTRLAILLRLSRWEEAAALINQLPPHSRWCDLGVAALVGNGQSKEAAQILEWATAQPDGSLRRKCLLMYADAAFTRALRKRQPGRALTPGTLTQQEHADLEDAERGFKPLLQIISGKGRIDSPLEEIAAIQAIKLYYLLGNLERVKELGLLLAVRRPVPVEYLRIILGRVVDPPENILTNAREDYPTAYEPRLLAAIIESTYFSRHAEGFDAAFGLIPSAKNDESRARLYFILAELSQDVGAERRAKLVPVAAQLLAHDVRLLTLARAGQALNAGDMISAASYLNKCKDESDSRWLQLQAALLVQSGQIDAAIKVLHQASEKIQHPELFRTIAELAFRQSNLTEAKWALQQLLQLDPRDIQARRNLAALHAELSEYADAANQFSILSSQVKDDRNYLLNYAICLARSNNLESSLSAYEQLCSKPLPTLNAVVGRSEVLEALGRPEEAFQSLAPHKEAMWNQINFVLKYMRLAFAAGQEDQANEALQHLGQLKGQGGDASAALEELSLDQMVELIGQSRDRYNSAHQSLLQGQIPRLLIDTTMRGGAYWGWRLRTQEMDWLNDDPIVRAEYSIYATNGFHSLQDSDGIKRLSPLECPAAGTEVVADLSSLITLHRLNLLDKAASYFGRILIPAAYLSYAFEESTSLVLHQRSQRTSAEQIRDAIEGGRIVLADTVDGDKIPVVDEHTTEAAGQESTSYRLSDLINDLRGRIPDPEIQSLQRIALRPPRKDSTHPALPQGNLVRFSLSTLETLATRQLLNVVLKVYRVALSVRDRDEVVARVAALRAREEVRLWQSDLWNQVRQDPRFVQQADSLFFGTDTLAADQPLNVSVSAMILARERGLPMLADDRMLQVVLLNERPQQGGAAFGTDALLMMLEASGGLTAAEHADRFLDLVRWRYRFLLPSPTLLKTVADRFKSNLPGKHLIDLAAYAQDCVRDAGLFCGPEAAEPPFSMALRLFQAWTGNIAEFLMEAGQDQSYDDLRLKQLIEWSLNVLLPSVPPGLEQQLQANSASITPRVVLGRAIIHAATAKDNERASATLLKIAEAMHLDPTQYLRIIAGVIDAEELR